MTDRDTNNNSVIWPAGTISGFFTASGHGNPDEKPFRHPAVKVSFHGGKGEDNNLVGMLDTGADLCTIDQGLADRLDLEDGGEMPVILAGHKSVRIMKKGTILLAGTNTHYQVNSPPRHYARAAISTTSCSAWISCGILACT